MHIILGVHAVACRECMHTAGMLVNTLHLKVVTYCSVSKKPCLICIAYTLYGQDCLDLQNLRFNNWVKYSLIVIWGGGAKYTMSLFYLLCIKTQKKSWLKCFLTCFLEKITFWAIVKKQLLNSIRGLFTPCFISWLFFAKYVHKNK